VAWTAFFAPAVALVLIAQVLPKLQADEAGVFASLCLALGLLNVAWGVLAAWRATDAAAAWRHTFIADWGLVLCGMGLLTPLVLGGKAAYLLLLSMLLVRLPLYVFAQPAIKSPEPGGDGERAGGGLIALLVGLALAGAAPFAGFAARLLLLQAAMTVAWPLAVVLLLAMLAYLAHCVRLGSSLGRPSRRTAIGIVVVLGVSTVLGVVPGVFLAVGGY
jgi:formate hydrogenlyase subunit 3/multisubunit Na+/H+ antiporter MnhD subunit